MKTRFIRDLLRLGFISEVQGDAILQWISGRAFSLHWEIRSALYAGVLAFTTGAGILIYKNIDAIGHVSVILLLSLLCAGSFAYCYKHSLPYSNERVSHPSPLFDYILLLGCLLFVTVEGYLQYQYELFGTRYGLATLLPAVLFLYLSFKFDHIGILALGITFLASFVGLTLKPGEVLSGAWNDPLLVNTGIAMGLLLILCGAILHGKSIKAHFKFTLQNYGIHMTGISILNADKDSGMLVLYLLGLIGGALILGWYAKRIMSRYFLLVAVIYGYIAFTWLLFELNVFTMTEFTMLYFLLSGIGISWFFISNNLIRKRKKSDGV